MIKEITIIFGQLRCILFKEYCQIKRNKSVLVIITLMPIIQLFVLPHAADYELRNIRMLIIDADHSSTSNELISHFRASRYYKIEQIEGDGQDAMERLRLGRGDLLLEIPKGMEDQMERKEKFALKITADATDAMRAELACGYTQSIILPSILKDNFGATNPPVINERYWYNGFRDYKFYMLPGILAFLLTMVATYLISLSIVEEKEFAVSRQLDMTPLRPLLMVIGKVICVWLLCQAVFVMGILIGWGAYGIVPKGSLLLLTAFVSVYLLSVTSMGSVIAYYCQNQSQAMLIAFFFMLIFILTGGLLTPISGMPWLARLLAQVNPVRLLIDVMRGVVMKGSSANELQKYLYGTGILLAGSVTFMISLYSKSLKK